MAEPRPTLGIFWMLLTVISFVVVTAIVKYLGSEIPAAQAAFLRYVLGLVLLIPMIRPLMAVRLTSRQIKLFGMRGLVHSVAVILWFFAMARIPMADVTAMNYLSPIYVTVGAALILKEPLPKRRLIAVCAGLLGALIILRPGMRVVEPGHIAMLGTALLFAASYLTAKQLSGEVSAVVIVGILSITVTIGLAPFAVAVWVPPTLHQLGWLFIVACVATAGHFTMTLAFAAAPVAVTQPVTFLQLVFAVIVGAVFFAEPIDIWVIVGGGVIVSAVSFIAWREAVAKRAVVQEN